MITVTVNKDPRTKQLQLWLETKDGKCFIQWLADCESVEPRCGGIMDKKSVQNLFEFLNDRLEEFKDVEK